MANQRKYIWTCPKCGQTLTLHIKATEVICRNKEAHTSTPIKMLPTPKTSPPTR
jgi:phage terminase large subunit GpA-like protein